MPTFPENIDIIDTAIYGKEMRPAIKEALIQTKDLISSMVVKFEDLQKRVDDLSGGGGSPDNPDEPVDPDQPVTPAGSYIVADIIECYDGVITELVAVDNADPF